MAKLVSRNAGPMSGMVLEHLNTGGKRLRARLALAAAEALGSDRMLCVPWAAACELLHNATLVHDDLQDGDRTRRGRPTVWATHGEAQAVNVGDLMLTLPYLAVEEVPVPAARRWLLVRALASHAVAVVRGQSTELGLSASRDISWTAYRRTVIGKTSALFQLPVEGASLLSGRSNAESRMLASAFRSLGVLFQLQDDLLDLYGDKGRGEAGSDLREGKVSSLVVEHLALHPNDRSWLLPLLATPRAETPADHVREAMDRFRLGGALPAVAARIRSEAHAALTSPVLHTKPPLRALAAELVQVALEPIRHLDGLGDTAHLLPLHPSPNGRPDLVP